MIIRLMFNGVQIGETGSPFDLPAMDDISISPVPHPSDVFDWYKEQAVIKVLSNRQFARTRSKITLGTDEHVLQINAENLAMLQMRSSIDTDGMWADVKGEMFFVSAAEYKEIIVQLITHGDWVFGQAEVYKMRINATEDKVELDTVVSEMEAAFEMYKLDVQ